jgi:tetratricopeptide (TPR) repeat protein
MKKTVNPMRYLTFCRPWPVVMLLTMAVNLVACGPREADESTTKVEAVALNDSAMVLFQQITLGQGDHSYTEVLELLNKAIDSDSTYRLAYMNKATVLKSDSRHDEAIHVLQQWLSTHPGDTQARTMQALVHGLSGQTELANEQLRLVLSDHNKAIDAHRDSLGLFLDRAFVLLLLGQRDEAIADIDSLMAAHPDSETVKMMRELVVQSDSQAVARSYLTKQTTPPRATRPPAAGYERPPREMQTYVPDHAASLYGR